MTHLAKLYSQLFLNHLVKDDSVIFLGLSPQDFQNLIENRGLTNIFWVMSTERKALIGNSTVRQSNTRVFKGVQTRETWSGQTPTCHALFLRQMCRVCKGENTNNTTFCPDWSVGSLNSSFGSVFSKYQAQAGGNSQVAVFLCCSQDC